MTLRETFEMKPYAGKPHIRFDEVESHRHRWVVGLCKNLLLVAVFAMTLVASAAVDYYVAADGNDENSGLSADEAKATISAAYTAMTNGTAEATAGNRLIVGEGEWTSDNIAGTIVLSNGWQLVGRYGRGKTVFKTVAANFTFFNLASADSAVRGITFDFNRAQVTYKQQAVKNPKGTIADCEFRNYYSTYIAASSGLIRIGFDSVRCAPVITNCIFRNNQNIYNGPSCIRTDVNAKNFIIVGCTFIDNVSGNNSWSAAGTMHFYRAQGIVRNCLFLRSVVHGSSATANVLSAGTASANMLVENCTFLDCKIYGFADAGAIGLSSSANSGYTANLTVKNCLAWGNYNSAAGKYVNLVTNTFTRASISYMNCACDYAPQGEGNVVLTPSNFIWQCATEERYIPSSGPSINAGATLDWMAGSTDIRGKDRIADGAPDIGCFEYHKPNVYYVASDGDDANDGLSRENAKKSLNEAYALLSDEDETLVVGDGEWMISNTLILTNGWKLAGENGRDKTVLKPSSKLTLLKMTTPGVQVKGIAFDFGSVANWNTYSTGALVNNPQGRFEDCILRNYKAEGATGDNSLVRTVISGVAGEFDDCIFQDCVVNYRSALFWSRNGAINFSNCQFMDCAAENAGVKKYFNYGIVYCEDSNNTIRNCLFARCKVYDSGADTMGKANVVNIKSGSDTVVENCSFVNCTITGNGIGGALGIIGSGNGGVVQNTFAYCCSNSVGQANLMTGLTYGYCASDTLLDGTGNILLADGSLRFRRPAKGDYTVVSGPTIDAGITQDWMADATDIKGRDRIIGGAVDIGCYEFDPRELLGTRVILR